MLSELLALVEKEGIILEWWNFEDPIEGIFLPEDNEIPATIGLKRDLDKNPQKFKSVLAEEIGHYFTCSSYFPKPSNYKEEIEYHRAEYRAKTFAVCLLLPLDKLMDALKKGYKETWQLAEYFGVSEELIIFRIKVWKVKGI
ncbi:MAG: ImmA/IrrE family metallo-endopeptidase [Dictyoglomus thermophilum]